MAGARPSSSLPTESPRLRIPKTNTDFTWSLRCWPAQFTVAGHEYTIPALPATDWISAILGMEEDVVGLLMDLLDPAEAQILNQSLAAGVADPEDLIDVAMDLVTTVGARPWWVTMRLIGAVKGSWETLGAEMFYRGIDPNRLSLSAWLDVTLLLMMRMMDPKDTTMFAMKLEMVPPEYADQVTEESMEIEPDAFLSMA